MDWHIALLRFALAFLLGACIGMERQLHQRAAGLRTNILVSLGSAAFTFFGSSLADADSVPRIVSQIVSGIGFLGAGAIMREGLTVQGLNTAATIWCCAALGSFCGMGLWLYACIFTSVIVITNTILRRVEWFLERRSPIRDKKTASFTVEVNCMVDHEEWVRKLILGYIKKRKVILHMMELKDRSNNHITLCVFIKNVTNPESQLQGIIEDLSLSPYIFSSKWFLSEEKNIVQSF